MTRFRLPTDLEDPSPDLREWTEMTLGYVSGLIKETYPVRFSTARRFVQEQAFSLYTDVRMTAPEEDPALSWERVVTTYYAAAREQRRASAKESRQDHVRDR
ncbi:MAG: hypothetical protein KKA90_03265 [Nanoarchaeota archaeon]|nr:hypothetical protein [Nanoarchaeota archaeon]